MFEGSALGPNSSALPSYDPAPRPNGSALTPSGSAFARLA